MHTALEGRERHVVYPERWATVGLSRLRACSSFCARFQRACCVNTVKVLRIPALSLIRNVNVGDVFCGGRQAPGT